MFMYEKLIWLVTMRGIYVEDPTTVVTVRDVFIDADMTVVTEDGDVEAGKTNDYGGCFILHL